jgi:replicative DNA helicase
MQVIEQRYRLKGELPGIRTGFSRLDDYLLGLQRGHLVLLAGKPGAGKTALGLNIAVNVARQENPVFVCSHEMRNAELMTRILSNDARVPGVLMETGQLGAEHYSRLVPASARIGATPMFFASDPPKTIPALMAECQTLKRKHGLALVVVDYLQLMDSADARGKSREQAVSEVSRGLKRIAMELGLCVLAMSQLNRQTDRNSEPALSELRESGALEQDANSVVMIWAQQDDSAVVLGKVAKNRSGQVGPFQLTFKRAIQRFEDAQ